MTYKDVSVRKGSACNGLMLDRAMAVPGEAFRMFHYVDSHIVHLRKLCTTPSITRTDASQPSVEVVVRS